MNHAYRLVWNEAARRYVPAAEGTRARGKSGSSRALKTLGAMAVVAASLGTAHAGPSGGEVVAGHATIELSGNTTTVNQLSNSASLEWQQFNIAANETVQFVQPSSTAVALNRVVGTDASQIYGRLSANGQVFLVNPNGVLFAPGAQVDVGGLVASTLNISDADFRAGHFKFQGESPASIVNEGTITAAAGGSVALLGGRVANNGTITAQLGTVALAAGSAVSLDFTGGRLMNVQIDAPTLDALVENHQLIRADGGMVVMTAAARDALLNTVVNNTGVIEARTVENQSGVIKLLGGFIGDATVPLANTGTTIVSGRLDASAPDGGNGGFIETSGDHVKIADGSVITTAAPYGKAGEWLIDPANYTIAASGGDISGATLSANLENGSVRIQSTQGAVDGSGDIFVNDNVTWSAATKLTLEAVHNIYVNAAITNTGSPAGGAVVLRSDSTGECAVAATCTMVNFSGAGHVTADQVDIYYNLRIFSDPQPDYSGVVTSNSLTGWMLVNDLSRLTSIAWNLGGNYALGRDIDASASSGSNGGSGFSPIAAGTSFTGRFDGLGHTISDLFVNWTSGGQGLFNDIAPGASVSNLRLSGGSVTGLSDIGALAGTNRGTVSNVSSTMTVHGDSNTGGLVGHNQGTIVSSSASGAVTGWDNVGGLVGLSGNSITDSYATGAVTGNNWIGGLVGSMYGGALSRSSATGSVSGVTNVGGLIGGVDGGTVELSYAEGAVTGSADVGGLAGYNSGSISRSYATGSTNGTNYNVGGLVGDNSGLIDQSFATGLLTFSDPGSAGGLAGNNTGSISNSYWDTVTTGQADLFDGRGTGIVTVQFTWQWIFGSWDFDNDWFMVENQTRPFLRSEYSTTIRNSHQLQLMLLDLNANYVLANDIDATDTQSPSGMWSSRGFLNVGNVSTPFNGHFDGAGHTINGLYMDFSNLSGQFGTGLFGQASQSAVIENVGLVGGSVTGTNHVGSLVGDNRGIVRNSYSTANVSGGYAVGGLVGNNLGDIFNSYAAGTVSGDQAVGGLVGVTAKLADDAIISNSYATGAVSGQSSTGGLVGAGGSGSYIIDSYATGNVSGSWITGGLIGGAGEIVIRGSYATGNVSTGAGASIVGGLVGFANGSSVSDSWASGSITSDAESIGGLFGGRVDGTVTNSYYDIDHVSINGAQRIGLGGLYHDQFQSWFDNDLALDVGQFSTSLVYDSQTDSYLIGSVQGLRDLLGFASHTGYKFRLTSDLDLAPAPGLYIPEFNAALFDGAGHRISNLSLASGATDLGMFGRIGAGSTIANLNLVNVSVSGVENVGGLAGNNQGTIRNSSVTGTVEGDRTVGGIAGISWNLSGSWSNAIVDGGTGTTIGGLVGWNPGTVSKSYSTGAVSGANTVGGLVGANSGVVRQAFATGTVSGSTSTGGLVGDSSDPIASIVDSFWDTDSSGQADLFDGRGVGKTSAEMTRLATFAGWGSDISSAGGSSATWRIYEGYTTPLLRAFMQSALIDVDAARVTYDTANYSGGVTFSGAGVDPGLIFEGSNSYRNAGAHDLGKLLYSSQVGYDIRYTGGALTIDRATLTVSGAQASNKVYDGALAAAVSGGVLSGILGSDDVDLSQSGAFRDKNVGTGKTVDVNFALAGNEAGNYVLASATGQATASISRASISGVTGIAGVNKAYDGTTVASLDFSGAAFAGMVQGDQLTVGRADGVFSDRNVAAGLSVAISGIDLGGADAGNYDLLLDTATTTGSITPKALTYTAVADDKIYDGTTTAAVEITGLAGLVGNESLTASATGSFNSKDVATANTVTVDLATLASGANGGLASNYSIAAGNTAAARITPKALTYGMVAQDKVYDGTTLASVALTGLAGFVGNETVTASGTGRFNSKDVATARTVTVDSAALSNGANGGLGSNYSVATGETAAARITRAGLTVTANDQRKLMGMLNPDLTVKYGGFVAGEDASVLTARPKVATTATQESPVGDYAITAADAAADNYTIAYVDGTLSVIDIAKPSYVGAVAYASNQDTFNASAMEEGDDKQRTQLLVVEGTGMRLPGGL